MTRPRLAQGGPMVELVMDRGVAEPAPAPAAPRGKPAHQPALDGLRGLAVLGVILYHSGFLAGGFLGVSTFFTLSGFLIASLLFAEWDAAGRIDLRAFWIRRVRRLLPASLVTLGGVALYGLFVADPSQLADLRGDVLATLGYVANWHFLTSGQSYADLFSTPSPVQHFWSLAVEEQFYLVFPLLAIGALSLGRGSRRIAGLIFGAGALASVALTVVLSQPGTGTDRIYYGTDARAAELLAGAVLAAVLPGLRGPTRWLFQRLTSVAGTVALVGMVTLWLTTARAEHWLYQGGLAAHALVTVAVLAAAVQPGFVQRMLSPAPLRWLGRVSYGAYLIHWPIFLWLTPSRTGLDDVPLLVVRLGMTLALAAVSQRWVERPLRVGTWLTGPRAGVAALAGVAAVAMATVGVTIDPPRPPLSLASAPSSAEAMAALPTVEVVSELRSEASTNDEVVRLNDEELLTQLSSRPVEHRPLLAGEQPRVLVVGDSVAWSLGFGLTAWGESTSRIEANGFGLLGCPISRGGAYRFSDGQVRTVYDECNRWADIWSDAVQRFHPHVVVVLDGKWDLSDRQLPHDDGTWRHIGDPVFDRYLRQEMRSLVDVVAADGARVVWLTTPPFRSGPMYAAAGEISGRNTDDYVEDRLDRLARLNHFVRQLDREDERVHVVDLAGYLDRLPGGPLDPGLRADGVHFDDMSGQATAAWLGPLLESIARDRPGRDPA